MKERQQRGVVRKECQIQYIMVVKMPNSGNQRDVLLDMETDIKKAPSINSEWIQVLWGLKLFQFLDASSRNFKITYAKLSRTVKGLRCYRTCKLAVSLLQFHGCWQKTEGPASEASRSQSCSCQDMFPSGLLVYN